MRVAFVSSDADVPGWESAGAAVRMRELSRALERLGHEATIFTPDPGGGTWDDLRRFRPGVVYERHSLFGMDGLALARLLGVPYVVEIHVRPADERIPRRGLAHAGAADALEQFQVGSADGVVAASARVARRLLAQGVDPARVAVVPNAVDSVAFSDAAARPALPSPFVRDGLAVVGFVGALRPGRDLETLIRAIAVLHRSGRPAGLMLVGDGPERSRLTRLVQEERLALATAFVGHVAHESVPDYIAAFDVAVVPAARTDAVDVPPLALLECLGAGRAVVAADAGEIRSCIQPCETGLVYSPGDARSLADAIGLLLHDPDFAASLGEAGRERVRTLHTWEAGAQAIVDLAGSLWNDHTPSPTTA